MRDHEQGGALLSPAVRLASTNSFKYTNNEPQQMRKIAPKAADWNLNAPRGPM